MGLGLSLSGFYNIGHDVGGFAGPKPDTELFLRWVQNGIFHPRFTIHSWNDDGTANEAWMYPEVTPLIREAVKFRAQLIPYLYSLLHRAVTKGEPMLRPLWLDFPTCPIARNAEFDFLLGPDLLVASVVEQGATSRQVALPACEDGWWSFDGSSWHAGGEIIDIPVALNTIPLFVRGGTVLPMAAASNSSDPKYDTHRTWRIYPHPNSGDLRQSQAYDDDGSSADALDGKHCLTSMTLGREENQIRLDWRSTGTFRPAFERIHIWQAGSDPLVINGSPLESEQSLPFSKA